MEQSDSSAQPSAHTTLTLSLLGLEEFTRSIDCTVELPHKVCSEVQDSSYSQALIALEGMWNFGNSSSSL